MFEWFLHVNWLFYHLQHLIVIQIWTLTQPFPFFSFQPVLCGLPAMLWLPGSSSALAFYFIFAEGLRVPACTHQHPLIHSTVSGEFWDVSWPGPGASKYPKQWHFHLSASQLVPAFPGMLYMVHTKHPNNSVLDLPVWRTLFQMSCSLSASSLANFRLDIMFFSEGKGFLLTQTHEWLTLTQQDPAAGPLMTLWGFCLFFQRYFLLNFYTNIKTQVWLSTGSL